LILFIDYGFDYSLAVSFQHFRISFIDPLLEYGSKYAYGRKVQFLTELKKGSLLIQKHALDGMKLFL
jgi:hypothetical protein